MARSFLLLWGHAASRALRGRRGLTLALLAALPAGLAWVQSHHDPHVNQTEFVGVTLMFVFQFVVPLAGLFLGVSVLGDEIEGRTLTYLFTRPQPRPLVFLARYLGVATAFAPLLAATIAVVAYFYGTRTTITAQQAIATAGIGIAGFLAYAAIFATLRLFTQRALFAGFIVGFIFEGGVSKLPDAAVARWTIWHHLALLETRVFGGKVAASGELQELLRAITPEETVRGSLVVLASIIAVSLVVGVMRVRSRETRLANAPT